VGHSQQRSGPAQRSGTARGVLPRALCGLVLGAHLAWGTEAPAAMAATGANLTVAASADVSAVPSPTNDMHPRRSPCPTSKLVTAAALPAAMRELVASPKKHAWEQSLGGEQAARPHIQARLVGWPARTLADRDALPTDDREFLLRVARDTWRGLDALRDRDSGLPIDNIRLTKTSVALADSAIGDYTSSTDIGLYLIDVVAAQQLGLVSHDDAVERIRRVLDTLDGLESYSGFLYNYYDTTSLERTSNFVSFVDASWLTGALMVLRMSVPELHARCTQLITHEDYRFFYDDAAQLISHGYYTNPGTRSPYHYGLLYTEARLGSLIAIGKGDVPECHWFEMLRTLPADCDGQTQTPRGITTKTVRGHRFSAGYYEENGVRYVPSWGGSMFEALMPTLLLDELRYAPKSLGANDQAHAAVQQRDAADALHYRVWGMSPSATPDNGYGEYGVRILGVRGYAAGVVTPHAAALALGVMPDATTANLRTLARLYDIYGEYGFYDAVDPRSGTVAYKYLALDQSMLFIALANYLGDHCIQKSFAADPIMQKVLPLIATEDFFD
jgi:hypothetical protein